MKKTFILNNKGFVLAETLVVAVAITVIFGIVFKNFYPLMGEYERRENYDDVDSKYGTYWIKRLIQSKDYNFSNVASDIASKGYSYFNCNNLMNESKKNMCYQLLVSLEVSCDVDDSSNDYIENCSDNTRQPHIYITNYALVKKDPATGEAVADQNMKEKMFQRNELSGDLKEYLRYLPEYSKAISLNRANYRVIVEYYRHRFDTDNVITNEDPLEYDTTRYIFDPDNDFKTFSTIEVKR